MSIYKKQVNDITFQDLAELLQDCARENVRLEFKREIPDKEKLLKNISSMANTYGGMLIIGLGQDNNGVASSLSSVPRSPGFHQQVIQWCYDNLVPLVTPSISPPIKDPSDPNKVFYVLRVPMSDQAPHFINGRRGCYVRTDEYSQLFKPQLATYEEIKHLADRRQHAIDMRERLISRARGRFITHANENYSSRKNVVGEIDTTMWLSCIPLYPAQNEFDIATLSRVVEEVRFDARNETLPNGNPEALLGGFFFPDPRIINFSYLEVNSRGLIYYSQELSYITPEAEERREQEGEDFLPKPSDNYIYANWILAWILFYLRYAKHIYRELGIEGPLLVRVGLDRIKNRQFRIPMYAKGDEFEEGRPLLDDDISVERVFQVHDLSSNVLDIPKTLFRAITFACGWRRAYTASEDFIELNIDRALNYLFWSREVLEQ